MRQYLPRSFTINLPLFLYFPTLSATSSFHQSISFSLTLPRSTIISLPIARMVAEEFDIRLFFLAPGWKENK